MQRNDLKKLIRECLLEIISEDFLKRIINEQVASKIQVDIRVPSSSRESLHESNEGAIAQAPQKKKLSAEEHERLRRAVAGEDISQTDISSLGLNPKVVKAVESFENPLLKSLAEDTLQKEASKREETSNFSTSEAGFVNIDKIRAIEDSLSGGQ